ncbi:MAG: KTSC domain-containing protein [Dehalococcoidia bacterium]|nr:MAG: KTSC domain-containing protein [Dehalococcoidia bacterium]
MTVTWESVESTNIDMIGYDEDNSQLHVKFRSGAEYVYNEVPPAVYQEFLDSDSKGKFLNERIKGRYNYARV